MVTVGFLYDGPKFGGFPAKNPLLVNAGPWIIGGVLDPSSAPMQMESSYKRHPTSLVILFG